jgi:Putative regulatory, ligand-binding protein related to C-terminal domains of K+ channels
MLLGGMSSLYYSIAVDLARRISQGDFSEGAKISGRTLLASQYKVSPETIRKAVGLLKEAEVVVVSRGREVEVLSSKNAEIFLQKWDATKPVQSFWEEFDSLIAEKRRIDQRFYHLLDEVANRSPRISALAPYRPFEVQISEGSQAIHQTICTLKIWQMTGATVVAVRRKTDFLVSPGPDMILEKDDWLVLVGPEESIPKMQKMAAFDSK